MTDPDDFLTRLSAALPAPALREVAPYYLAEPRGRWQGRALAVVAPGSAEEAAIAVRLASEASVPVIPYGGGTGLVGGQLAEGGAAPLLISLERMTRIREVYPEENVMIVEAGAILSDVHDAAEKVQRLFPLSIAAKGSARIGGLLATNAGGVNVLRYGNARDLCLGLEAVMPSGDIWHGLKRLRKDNTGYDLRNLLIGSEGTLGLITAATLKLAPRPAGEGTALMVVDGPGAALRLLSMARDHMGEGVSAFELMHREGLNFLAETMPQVRQPWPEPPEWFVLIDVGLARGLDPAGALEALFEAALDEGLVSDGMIAQSGAQRSEFWNIRETIPEANRHIGAICSHDVSLPLGAVAQFVAAAPGALARIGQFRINCFGHLGDGNLHYNVFPMPGGNRADHAGQREAITACVHDLVHAMDGSVSAEHGIGRLKVADLERYGDPAKLSAMRAIKAALDPKGIMNPGAVLRAE
ncbi:FAD-binding oxidoreductase [Roseovarius nanhaiticus]|uniref:FAD-binding oxidoreductase n=1 Tax=Roseovarius nanhaiticus TaxID=573024 RepID=UPI0024906972|nr:FAD-binding oxidoreductase [Roseovarius nanhaiticus]